MNLLVSIHLQICTSQGNVQNIAVTLRIIFNIRVETLQNKFIVDGGGHDTIIHVLVMSSKLTKYQSYYVAHLILIFIAAYSAPYPQHSEFEDISDTTNTLVISYNATYHFNRMPDIVFIILCRTLITRFSENIQLQLTGFTAST